MLSLTGVFCYGVKYQNLGSSGPLIEKFGGPLQSLGGPMFDGAQFRNIQITF